MNAEQEKFWKQLEKSILEHDLVSFFKNLLFQFSLRRRNGGRNNTGNRPPEDLLPEMQSRLWRLRVVEGSLLERTFDGCEAPPLFRLRKDVLQQFEDEATSGRHPSEGQELQVLRLFQTVRQKTWHGNIFETCQTNKFTANLAFVFKHL